MLHSTSYLPFHRFNLYVPDLTHLSLQNIIPFSFRFCYFPCISSKIFVVLKSTHEIYHLNHCSVYSSVALNTFRLLYHHHRHWISSVPTYFKVCVVGLRHRPAQTAIPQLSCRGIVRSVGVWCHLSVRSLRCCLLAIGSFQEQTSCFVLTPENSEFSL